MIPKKYIDQQNEIKKILLTIKDWEKRYLQEFSNETGKWKTLRIQHLKRFENSGGSNILFYYEDEEKKFLDWIYSNKDPELIYFANEFNWKWLNSAKGKKYDYGSIQIDRKLSDPLRGDNTFIYEPITKESVEYYKKRKTGCLGVILTIGTLFLGLMILIYTI